MKKADLPVKHCPVCQRPFTWRKKWERCWEEVKYCSDRCRKEKNAYTAMPQTATPPTLNPKSPNRKS